MINFLLRYMTQPKGTRHGDCQLLCRDRWKWCAKGASKSAEDGAFAPIYLRQRPNPLTAEGLADDGGDGRG